MEINKLIKERTREVEKEISQMDQTQAMTSVFKEDSKILVEILKENPTVIQVAGNIGLGKTTNARIIGTFGKIEEVLEDDKNPLLEWYYEDMSGYGEILQVDLIYQRFSQMILNKQQYPNQSLIFDRTPYEDPLIFSKALMELDLMTKKSYNFCKDYFNMRKERLETIHRKILGSKGLDPDLIILLNSSEEKGWEQVLKRGRAIENLEDAEKGVGLTPEFYHALHCEYENFAETLKEYYTGPIVPLAQDSIEVSDLSNTKGMLCAVRSVKEALKIIYD
ncbi:deoxynucleoside kinase [Candidatus Woesearchaeota archaeon]|nr:deoxynucleoside kinase [Candidatus Woesearchaeota archaeon]